MSIFAAKKISDYKNFRKNIILKISMSIKRGQI